MPVRHARDARPSALRSRWPTGKERFDHIPQRIWKERGGHTRPRYPQTIRCHTAGRGVLLHALSKYAPLHKYLVGQTAKAVILSFL